MLLDIVDIGDFLFSATERLFDTADGIEEFVSGGSESLSVDLENLSPELEELRKSGCDALSEIIALMDLPLYELEAAFEETEIASYAKAVLELEKRILGYARYKEDPKNNSREALKGFLVDLIDGNSSELEEEQKLSPIAFTYEEAQAARNALKDAHKYVCKPSSLVADKLTPVKKLKTVAALCRDTGFLSADLAAACGGMVEPTGLVLFTSAKSVVTSSLRIKKTIDGLEMSKPDQRKATGNIHKSTSDIIKKESAINQIMVRRIKRRGIKKIKGLKI